LGLAPHDINEEGRMAEAKESTVQVRDARIFMRRSGAGAPLVFLHGAGGTSGWTPFLAKLADRYDVIAPDLPSFSRSPRPEWLDDMSDMAYFMLDFLAALELKSVHLVGYSIGGWVAQELAIRSTARLASLTLISAAGIRVKGKPAADLFMMDRGQQVRALFADPKLAEQILAAPLTQEQQDEIINNSIAAARLCWQPRFFNPKLATWLHRIDVPTQILWGDSDRLIPPENGPELQRLIPGAKLQVFQKTGHALHIERTEAAVSAINDFIGRR
jgi:pimeloyl-ACP methyl ester carboxylesterase